MKYDHALTSKEFKNPYLINTNLDETIIIDNNKLTAEYIWSLNEKERLDLIQKIKDYFKEFPTEELDKDYIDNQYKKLVKYDQNEVIAEDGTLKNSSSLCLDILRYYNRDNFYNVSGESQMSLKKVFENNLESVLKNRMGWYTSMEDNTERPYVFNITAKMIRQGIRSSGLGFNVSQIKPVVIKYLYSKYAKQKTLDYSAGWGARAIAACSLGLEYYGIDPLTAVDVNRIIKRFNGKGVCIKSGSEVNDIYNAIPEVDCVLSCPPYFTLEIYSDDNNQSVKKYSEYEAWLEFYWKETVKNCYSKLTNDGYFILIMIEKYKKYNIATDMCKVMEEVGLKFVEELSYKTIRNHLSGKKKSGVISKNSEKVYVFKKVL